MMDKDIQGADEVRVEPFLAQFAVERHRAADLPGAYCEERHVWVIPAYVGSLPIVEASVGDILEIQTKTMQNVEVDDHVQRVAPGGEAHAAAMSALLEITTKTDANLESEDVVTRH